MFYISFLFSLCSLFYLARRFVKNPLEEVLNPLLYLCVFSIFYYLIGGFVDEFVGKILGLSISNTSYQYGKIISLYTCSIYLLFYFFCNKRVIIKKDEMSISKLSEYFLFFINIITILIGLYLVITKGVELYLFSSSNSRVKTYELYNEMVSGYPLGILLNISLMASALLYLSKDRSLVVFIPSLLLTIFPFLGNGRTYLSTALIAIAMCLVIKKPDKSKKYILGVLGAASMLLLISIKDTSNFLMLIYNSTAEFAHTYITIPLLIEKSQYLSSGDSFSYYTNPLLKFFGLEQNLVYLSDSLYAIAGTPFSLASNNISEALFYGGWIQALLQPIFVSVVCVILYNIRFPKIISFVLLFMICLYMRTAVRGGIYQSFTSLIVYIVFILGVMFLLGNLNYKIKKR